MDSATSLASRTIFSSQNSLFNYSVNVINVDILSLNFSSPNLHSALLKMDQLWL